MPTKKSHDKRRSDLLYFAGRLSLELHRLDDELKPNRKLPRHTHYHYIGDEPSTGRVSYMSNPELFETHEGFPVLFNGLTQVLADMYDLVEEIDGNDQSSEV